MEKNNVERIEKLLALILLNQISGKNQKEKAITLNLGGFSNTEIADLLQVKSSQVIANYLYTSKKSKIKYGKILA